MSDAEFKLLSESKITDKSILKILLENMTIDKKIKQMFRGCFYNSHIHCTYVTGMFCIAVTLGRNAVNR